MSSLCFYYIYIQKADVPKQSFFLDVYKNAAGKPVPWDIHTHQPALESVADQFNGTVIDVGCGLGDNSRWYAIYLQKMKIIRSRV